MVGELPVAVGIGLVSVRALIHYLGHTIYRREALDIRTATRSVWDLLDACGDYF